MDAQQMFKEHHNQCRKKVRAPEEQLQSLTGPYGVVPACLRRVQRASVQAITLYRSELWWDPKEGSWRDDLQLLLNPQARSTLGALPTTLRGVLMRDSGLTLVALALDARQQWMVARLAIVCTGSKSKELYDYPAPGAQVGRVAAIDPACGKTAEAMCWPDPGEEPAVKTTILEDSAVAKRAAEPWAWETECTVGCGTWTRWMDGSHLDDRWVGAAAMCSNGDGCTVFHSYLGTGWMEALNAELWAIRLGLRKSIASAEALRAPAVMTMAVFSDSKAAIRLTAHLDPGPGQQLPWAINEHAWVLHAHGIEAGIHCVPGHLGILGNHEADHLAKQAWEDQCSTVHKQIYTSAVNSSRRMSEARTPPKAEWEASKPSRKYSYRLKGKARSKRSVPMTSVKSLAARFKRLQSGHEPTRTYLKWFGQWEDDKCWWCGSGTSKTQEHLVRHFSRWKAQQKGGEKGRWMENQQIPACANVWAFPQRNMRSSSDGRPGGNWCRKVHAKTSGGAQAGGAWAGGLQVGWMVFGPRAVSLSLC